MCQNVVFYFRLNIFIIRDSLVVDKTSTYIASVRIGIPNLIIRLSIKNNVSAAMRHIPSPGAWH